MRKLHVEAQNQLGLRRFDRTHSSADPLWARLPPLFLLVADMWVLKYISGVCSILRRFGRRVGPWILMTFMWRILIRWGLPLLD